GELIESELAARRGGAGLATGHAPAYQGAAWSVRKAVPKDGLIDDDAQRGLAELHAQAMPAIRARHRRGHAHDPRHLRLIVVCITSNYDGDDARPGRCAELCLDQPGCPGGVAAIVEVDTGAAFRDRLAESMLDHLPRHRQQEGLASRRRSASQGKLAL